MSTHVFKPLTIALLLGVAPLSISTAYAVAAVAGPAGPAGATGARGATGLTGAAGAKGNNGSNGAQGIPGLRGLAGTNGTNGTNGATGARGLTGATGPSGGVKGDTGIQGDQGIQGAQGIQGDQGLPGADGTSQAGNDAGDMQFWDGSTWVIVPAPKSATGSLEFCNGVPGWNVKSTCPPLVRSIGDNGPAGGIVFYVTDAGLHGLEAAPADQASSAWGCYGTSISGADGTAVGTGAANTADIVAGCAEANTAAKIADAYALNGYTDWYLPSKDELNLLYQQKTVVGGFASDGYWSSSQLSSDNAWLQRFNYGFQNSLSKYYTLPVRAVRAF